MQRLAVEFERVLCGNAVRIPINHKNVARSSRNQVNCRKDETASMPSRVLWLGGISLFVVFDMAIFQSSMVVCYFNIVGIAIDKTETYSPLLVN